MRIENENWEWDGKRMWNGKVKKRYERGSCNLVNRIKIKPHCMRFKLIWWGVGIKG